MSTITIEVPDHLSADQRAEMLEHLRKEAAHVAYTYELSAKWQELKDKPDSFWSNIPVDALDEKD